MLAKIMWVLFLCAVSRYVDDFFGADMEGVLISGGSCITMVGLLVGFSMDDDKNSDWASSMIVLGARTVIDYGEQSVATAVDEEKAVNWTLDLEDIELSGICLPDRAEKWPVALASRLGS